VEDRGKMKTAKNEPEVRIAALEKKVVELETAKKICRVCWDPADAWTEATDRWMEEFTSAVARAKKTSDKTFIGWLNRKKKG
jgi:hypothetical protein